MVQAIPRRGTRVSGQVTINGRSPSWRVTPTPAWPSASVPARRNDAPSVLEELWRRERDPSWSRQSAAQHGSNEAGATRRRPLRREPAYSRAPVGGGDVATLGT